MSIAFIMLNSPVNKKDTAMPLKLSARESQSRVATAEKVRLIHEAINLSLYAIFKTFCDVHINCSGKFIGSYL